MSFMASVTISLVAGPRRTRRFLGPSTSLGSFFLRALAALALVPLGIFLAFLILCNKQDRLVSKIAKTLPKKTFPSSISGSACPDARLLEA